ncbi:MAG: hypothetical protein OXK80_00690 [Bdellovibrionales bacterium]|nr:hypothetical protein [Bdellovibrionales bacterium]
MNKTDRLIITLSIGVFLISIAYTFATVKSQNIQKQNALIMERKHEILGTINIKIIRTYHEDQMFLLKEILHELRNNKQIQPVNTQCL